MHKQYLNTARSSIPRLRFLGAIRERTRLNANFQFDDTDGMEQEAPPEEPRPMRPSEYAPLNGSETPTASVRIRAFSVGFLDYGTGTFLDASR
ncbi:hypothetical protein [Pontiella sp.]|uniref:hypothetical protein n=1 Tax=Pontiella sp. TaxID=2837462 RepID=UPI003561E7E7